MPIYGLVGRPHGLALCSAATSGTAHRLMSLTTTFAAFPDNQLSRSSGALSKPSRAFRLTSHDVIAYDSRVVFRPNRSQSGAPWASVISRLRDQLPEEVRDKIVRQVRDQLSQEAALLSWEYGSVAEDGRGTGEAQVLRQDVMLDKLSFLGEILCWPWPHPLYAFRLQQQESRVLLTGAAYGLEKRGLLALLSQLVPINERPDLLAQYQAELDQRRPSWWGGRVRLR